MNDLLSFYTTYNLIQAPYCDIRYTDFLIQSKTIIGLPGVTFARVYFHDLFYLSGALVTSKI
jgi:hypothetical protein